VEAEVGRSRRGGRARSARPPCALCLGRCTRRAPPDRHGGALPRPLQGARSSSAPRRRPQGREGKLRPV
jgi:hypothetical protein